jgi:hypothetical protein
MMATKSNFRTLNILHLFQQPLLLLERISHILLTTFPAFVVLFLGLGLLLLLVLQLEPLVLLLLEHETHSQNR